MGLGSSGSGPVKTLPQPAFERGMSAGGSEMDTLVEGGQHVIRSVYQPVWGKLESGAAGGWGRMYQTTLPYHTSLATELCMCVRQRGFTEKLKMSSQPLFSVYRVSSTPEERLNSVWKLSHTRMWNPVCWGVWAFEQFVNCSRRPEDVPTLLKIKVLKWLCI